MSFLPAPPLDSLFRFPLEFPSFGGYVASKGGRVAVIVVAIFVGISFARLLVEQFHPRTDPNAKVATLVREASGISPTDRRSGFDSPLDRHFRGVMTEFLDNVKTHREKTHELK